MKTCKLDQSKFSLRDCNCVHFAFSYAQMKAIIKLIFWTLHIRIQLAQKPLSSLLDEKINIVSISLRWFPLYKSINSNSEAILVQQSEANCNIITLNIFFDWFSEKLITTVGSNLIVKLCFRSHPLCHLRSNQCIRNVCKKKIIVQSKCFNVATITTEKTVFYRRRVASAK